MLKLLEWVKNKMMCNKYKAKGCEYCPHCCNGHDYWDACWGLNVKYKINIGKSKY